MKLTVAQIGNETENGNQIVKLQRQTEIETGLGVERQSVTYYKAVKAGTIKVDVEDEVELDLDNYNVVERPFEHPETGEEMMLKWLHLKTA